MPSNPEDVFAYPYSAFSHNDSKYNIAAAAAASASTAAAATNPLYFGYFSQAYYPPVSSTSAPFITMPTPSDLLTNTPQTLTSQAQFFSVSETENGHNAKGPDDIDLKSLLQGNCVNNTAEMEAFLQ